MLEESYYFFSQSTEINSTLEFDLLPQELSWNSDKKQLNQLWLLRGLIGYNYVPITTWSQMADTEFFYISFNQLITLWDKPGVNIDLILFDHMVEPRRRKSSALPHTD